MSVLTSADIVAADHSSVSIREKIGAKARSRWSATSRIEPGGSFTGVRAPWRKNTCTLCERNMVQKLGEMEKVEGGGAVATIVS